MGRDDRINLIGAWQAVETLIPAMIEAGKSARSSHPSSWFGHIGFPGIAHYNAASTSVVGLMRSLADELVPHMIRVNGISPVCVASPMIMNQPIVTLFKRPSGRHHS